MTVENISWSISTKECGRPRRGLNPQPPGLQSDGASNWATEADEVEKGPPESKGLGAAFEAGLSSNLTKPSGISYFSLYTSF